MFKDISDVIDKGFNAVVLNGKLYEIQGGFKDSLLVGPPNEDVSFEIRLSEVGYFTIMDKSRQSVLEDGSDLECGINAIMKDGVVYEILQQTGLTIVVRNTSTGELRNIKANNVDKYLSL